MNPYDYYGSSGMEENELYEYEKFHQEHDDDWDAMDWYNYENYTDNGEVDY